MFADGLHGPQRALGELFRLLYLHQWTVWLLVHTHRHLEEREGEGVGGRVRVSHQGTVWLLVHTHRHLEEREGEGEGGH